MRPLLQESFLWQWPQKRQCSPCVPHINQVLKTTENAKTHIKPQKFALKIKKAKTGTGLAPLLHRQPPLNTFPTNLSHPRKHHLSIHAFTISGYTWKAPDPVHPPPAGFAARNLRGSSLQDSLLQAISVITNGSQNTPMTLFVPRFTGKMNTSIKALITTVFEGFSTPN